MSSGSNYIEPRPDSDEPAPELSPDQLRRPGPAATSDGVERRSFVAASHLVARTVLTRGITLIGTVALARMLSPADFGVYAVITLVVTILTIAGDLGMGAGLVQQRDDPDQSDVQTVFAVQLALFGGLGLAAMLVGPTVAVLLRLGPGSSELAVLMALTIVIIPARGIPVAMLSRSLRFGPLAASEVAQQAAFFAVAVGCAAVGVGVVSFGVAAVVQSIVATVVLWAAWRERPPRPRLHRAIAARLWRFGIRMQGANIAAWAKDAVVPVFGGLAGGVIAVGYLQFAWRNGQLVSAIDEVVTRVGFPALSRLQHDPARFSRVSEAAMESAVLIAVGIQAWLIATAPVLIPQVFSAQWNPAVDAFRLVAAGAIAGTMSSVIRTALSAAGRSDTALRAALIGLTVTLVAFPVGVMVGGVSGGGVAFVVSSMVALGANVWLARSRVRIPWAACIRIVLVAAAAAFVAVIIVSARPDLAGLLLSGLAYAAAFGLLALAFEGRILRLLWLGLRSSRRGMAPDPGR